MHSAVILWSHLFLLKGSQKTYDWDMHRCEYEVVLATYEGGHLCYSFFYWSELKQECVFWIKTECRLASCRNNCPVTWTIRVSGRQGAFDLLMLLSGELWFLMLGAAFSFWDRKWCSISNISVTLIRRPIQIGRREIGMQIFLR